MKKSLQGAQSGFALLPVIALFTAAVAISAVTWRVHDTQQRARLDKQNQATLQAAQIAQDSIKSLDHKSIVNESVKGQKTEQASPESAKQEDKAISGSKPPVATTTKPATPTNNSTTGAAPKPPSSITRPTAEFCAQKKGGTFTNAWLTDNNQYTYQVWDSGQSKLINKTETGTPAKNSDTMNIVDVIPHLTKPSWAHCSEKAGFVMIYYTPGGSDPYTYNLLVAFAHISLSQP